MSNSQRSPVQSRDVQANAMRLVDKQGREVRLYGINLIHKGDRRSDGTVNFYPAWPADLYKRFRAQGFNVIRFGILWAAVEPEPGKYDEEYLAYIQKQLDQAEQAGISVILDMHQDLYAQRFSDGAPDWAALTDKAFEATALWSDAYLTSPAVQECWDAFWQNRKVPLTGKGLQDYFADTWSFLARRFHQHGALFAYDFLNEPAPGSEIQEMFAMLLMAFYGILTPEERAQLDVETPDIAALAEMFSDPDKKLRALDVLNDAQRYRMLGEACKEPVIRFERKVLEPFYEKMTTAIRKIDQHSFILRNNNYMSNIGIPSGIRPIKINGVQDERQIFAPHGYDLVVDTPAIDRASDSRAESIFARHRETQLSLQLPAIASEWGAFAQSDAAFTHGVYLKNLFDSYGWSNTYWCYTDDFFTSPAKQLLTYHE